MPRRIMACPLAVVLLSLLPGDDASEGFDNIADVLGVFPSLMQGYLAGAAGFPPAAPRP